MGLSYNTLSNTYGVLSVHLFAFRVVVSLWTERSGGLDFSKPPLKLYFEHRNWSAQRRFFLFCRRADRLYIWLYQYCKIELLQNCPNAHFFRQKNSPNCFTFVAILNSLHFRPQNNPFEQEHGCAKIVRYMAQNIQKSR